MSFIDAHDFPAGLVLRVLGIAESTYYDWRARRASPSRRELDDAALLEQILKIRAAHEFAATYGSPRVWLELRRQGVRVGRKRVERLMRTHGLAGAHLSRPGSRGVFGHAGGLQSVLGGSWGSVPPRPSPSAGVWDEALRTVAGAGVARLPSPHPGFDPADQGML
jgi:transposase InsO family protein